MSAEEGERLWAEAYQAQVKRSQAASKAWETRRAEALAERRSGAARKAWETRRAAEALTPQARRERLGR